MYLTENVLTSQAPILSRHAVHKNPLSAKTHTVHTCICRNTTISLSVSADKRDYMLLRTLLEVCKDKMGHSNIQSSMQDHLNFYRYAAFWGSSLSIIWGSWSAFTKRHSHRCLFLLKPHFMQKIDLPSVVMIVKCTLMLSDSGVYGLMMLFSPDFIVLYYSTIKVWFPQKLSCKESSNA